MIFVLLIFILTFKFSFYLICIISNIYLIINSFNALTFLTKKIVLNSNGILLYLKKCIKKKILANILHQFIQLLSLLEYFCNTVNSRIHLHTLNLIFLTFSIFFTRMYLFLSVQEFYKYSIAFKGNVSHTL